MMKIPRVRRAIALAMVVLGAILMFLAPEAWPGEVVLVLGIAVELAGIALEQRAK